MLFFYFFWIFAFSIIFFTTPQECLYLHRMRVSLPSPHEGVFSFTVRERLLDWSYPFFITLRCLLNWAYDPQAAKSGSLLFSHIDAYLIGFTIHNLPKIGLTLFHFFLFFNFDLTLIVSSSNFHFFIYLDLPLIASSLYFHIWAYL